MEKTYNFIYTTLVKDENDFVGQVAYCLYKQDKIKHIQNFRIENPDLPVEPEIFKYYEKSLDPRLIEAYQRNAEEILQDFVSDIVKEAGDEMINDMELGQIERLQKIIAPIIPPSGKKLFWIGVLQNLISTIGFAIFLGILILILYTSKVGFIQAMETLFNVKVSSITSNK